MAIKYNENFIAISDKKQKPINSLEPFESIDHRILHDTLAYYVQSYRMEENFHKTMKIITKYIDQNNTGPQSDVTITEIKFLLAISIINHFKIGSFHIGLLDFEIANDADVFYHLKVFDRYSYDDIVKSAKKHISEYDPEDYVKCKSHLYLTQMYASYTYNILSCQMANKKWCWKDSDHFVNLVGNNMPTEYKYLRHIFEQKERQCIEYHLTLSDILNRKLCFKNLLESISRNGSVGVFFLYSRFEAYKTIKQYNNVRKIKKVPKSPYETALGFYSNFGNLAIVRKFIRRMNACEHIDYDGWYTFPVLWYEFYKNLEDVSESYAFEQWEKDALKLRKKLNEAQDYFAEWFCD